MSTGKRKVIVGVGSPRELVGNNIYIAVNAINAEQINASATSNKQFQFKRYLTESGNSVGRAKEASNIYDGTTWSYTEPNEFIRDIIDLNKAEADYTPLIKLGTQAISSGRLFLKNLERKF